MVYGPWMKFCWHAQEFITAAMDRKRALTSDMLTRVFSELDDDDDGELGPRVFCSALQVRQDITQAGRIDVTHPSRALENVHLAHWRFVRRHLSAAGCMQWCGGASLWVLPRLMRACRTVTSTSRKRMCPS